jgi:hypothetical protein
VARELRGSTRLDAILVATPGVAEGARVVASAAEIARSLGAAREEGAWLAWESHDPRAHAALALSEGLADAVLLVGEPVPPPRLRVREGTRVLEPGSSDLRDSLTQAARLLECLGVRRPRLVVFAGPRAKEQALGNARLAGVDVLGPLGPRSASAERPDAWVTWTDDQAELTLGLCGAGPETAFDLQGRWAAPAEGGQRDLLLAAQRLGALAEERGDLAAERDPVAPVVNVSARPPAPKRGRCPYCHRKLSESPDGRRGPPGPPVVCEACGTGHHRDCLSEHGKCTVLGCKSRRFQRLGAVVFLGDLGVEDAREWPFASLPGDAGSGPAWLRVEAPLDEQDGPPIARRISIEVPSRLTRRGERFEGHVLVANPKEQRISGGTFAVRAALTTRPLEGKRPPRVQTILARQACFLGEPPSALARLTLKMGNLLGGGGGVLLPACVRRYPFSFEVPVDHPRTLCNRQGAEEEEVRTRLVVELGGQRAEIELQVK